MELFDLIVGTISFCGLIASLIMYDFFIMDIKSECMKNLIKVFGNIIYDKSGTLSDEELNKSELFPVFLSQSTDDCFRGTYKNVAFKAVEALLYGEAGKSVFKGVIISIQFNNKTIITDQNNLKSKTTNIVYNLFHF